MCTEADVELVFLSFYFLNYNLIEQFFVTLKQWMQQHENLVKKYKNDFESLYNWQWRNITVTNIQKRIFEVHI